MKTYELIATATFGLEAVVKRELKQLGYNIVSTENGSITFEGTLQDVIITNLWLRSADRVLLKIMSCKATTFDQLYEQVRTFPWQDFVPEDGAFIINAKSLKSKLYSLRDIQKITKKAIADKLMFAYKTHWLNEEGNTYSFLVSIMKDVVTITLDTSGEGLHKRGYRVETVDAPLKETLAAGLIQLSYWSKDRLLYDVFCGSGTIPIEAAMIGRNIAPGLQRDFAAKHWPNMIPQSMWKEETKKAYQAIDYDSEIHIEASDIRADNIEKAKENAIEAGVDDCITFTVSDFKDRSYDTTHGVLVSNPPYGERLMEEEEVIELTRRMKQCFSHLDTWSLYFLTSFKQFEQHYGKSADRKRKLYNGRIETWYYQYYGPPPKKES